MEILILQLLASKKNKYYGVDTTFGRSIIVLMIRNSIVSHNIIIMYNFYNYRIAEIFRERKILPKLAPVYCMKFRRILFSPMQ